VDVGTVPSPLDQVNTHGPRSYTDTTYRTNYTGSYRVVAQNTIGYGGEFMSLTAQSISAPVTTATPPAAPSNLTAALQTGPQVSLSWRDNATNETGFIIERSTGGAFAQIGTAPARNSTGGVSFIDTAVTPGVTYTYRVAATNAAGSSAYSNTASVTVPAVPAVPATFTVTNGVNASRTSRVVNLTWTVSSTANLTGFTVQRATNATFTSGLSTTTYSASTRSATQTGLNANTLYYFRIRANNGTIIFSGWLNATPQPIRTNP
jgi:hypothetical protein